MEPEPPRILLLSRAEPTLILLSQVAESLGATVCRGVVSPVPTGEWCLVCADEAVVDSVGQLRAGRSPVLWLSDQPRGAGAAAALAEGAADVLALPLWEAEVRARLGHWLSAARQRSMESGSLRWLLDAQQELIPLQVPRQIVTRMREGLQRLFPGAAVEILLDTGDRREAPGSGSVEDGAGLWASAVVPLESGGVLLGEVRIDAPEGAAYPAGELRLLNAYAAQAAQGLHRTRLYEALSEGKADWERTFDTIPDSITVVGSDRVLRRVNRALAESVGKAPREIVGKLCHQVLHGSPSPCNPCPVDQVFQTGEAVHYPQEVRRGDRVFDYRAFPLLDDDGGVRAVITYGRDVTREEQLAQGLRHSEKLMTLGQIAAGIAHEINNPLTAISSYAQLLGMQAEGPKGVESARRIQVGTERIHRLVQNLMSFARPADDTFYPLDLNEIVAKALSFSQYEVTRGETRLEQQLQTGLPKVLGSEAQLEQLLVNLLTNARDAVGGRGTVGIATVSDGDQVHLAVSDDGVGFAQADAERLFEPFYTTKPVGKGTGLGLFIAAGIAEKHRGILKLNSHPGRGTEARLTLPAFA